MMPGIGVAMIVRNDAKRLERCLESVRGVANGIYIVDTGSTDGSQDVARSFGAHLVERPWPDDFAQALNWSYELVQNEWTLRLDSDEWLLPGASAHLQQTIARSDIFAATVVREDYIADGRFAECHTLRLWRTDPAMRMVGFVHEQFPDSATEAASRGRSILASDIRLGHDGYVEAALPDKHRRNLALLDRELALRPDGEYYKAERVRVLYILNDPEAPSAAARLIDGWLAQSGDDRPPTLMAAGPLTLYLDRLSDSQLKEQRTSDVLRLARGWFHDDPAVTYAAAKTFVRRNDLRSALDAFLDLERMSESGEYARSGFHHPSMLEEALWQNLAIVAHQLGKKDIAARNYERLLRRDPNDQVALKNMGMLLRS
jgi:glycosyltransferase involved in cell wall biosynthesis